MSSHLSNSRRSPCECKVVTLGERLLLSHTPSKPQLGSHAQPLLARHPILPRKQGGKPAPSPRTPSGDSDSCRGIVQMSGASHPSVCSDSSPYRVKTCRPRVRLPFPPGCLGLCRGPQPLALSPVFSDLGAFPNQDATPGMSRRGDEEGKSLPAEVLEGFAASEGLAVHSLVHALGRCRQSGRLSLAGPWATRRGPCSPATYALV